MATAATTATATAGETRGPSWGALAAFGMASRVVVLAAGVWLARPTPQLLGKFRDSPEHVAAIQHRARETIGHGRVRAWVGPWHDFDAVWYLRVARDGYRYAPGRECTAAFLPLLPMALSAGARVGLDPYLVGLIVPNLAFVAGLACFGRLVSRESGSAAVAWRACVLLVAYPGSFVFSAPYQESLSFALTAFALLAWQNRRPGWSAVGVGLASLARLSAAALPCGLLACWFADRARGRPARDGSWLAAGSYALGVAGFCGFSAWRLGDPFAHFKSHAAWRRAPPSVVNVLDLLVSPIADMAGARKWALLLVFGLALAWALREPLGLARWPLRWSDPASAFVVVAAFVALRRDAATDPAFPWLNALAAFTTLGLGVRAWWKRGPLWGCLVLVPILQALSTGSLMSLSRIVLSAFPVFLDAAERIEGRLTFAAVVVAGLAAQQAALDGFVNFVFVG